MRLPFSKVLLTATSALLTQLLLSQQALAFKTLFTPCKEEERLKDSQIGRQLSLGIIVSSLLTPEWARRIEGILAGVSHRSNVPRRFAAGDLFEFEIRKNCFTCASEVAALN